MNAEQEFSWQLILTDSTAGSAVLHSSIRVKTDLSNSKPKERKRNDHLVSSCNEFLIMKFV